MNSADLEKLVELVPAVDDLKRRVAALEKVSLSANMDAASKGADMAALPAKVRETLEEAGYTTPLVLKAMSVAELKGIPGVGAATAKLIKGTLG